MAWLKCPVCGETREYDSNDMTPRGWSGCEEMEFHCKACQRELTMEIDYDFQFFETLTYDDKTGDYLDVLRYTIPEARALYEKQNAPSRFSLGGGMFSLGPANNGFSLGPPKSSFSLSAPGRFSLTNRKSRKGRRSR